MCRCLDVALQEDLPAKAESSKITSRIVRMCLRSPVAVEKWGLLLLIVGAEYGSRNQIRLMALKKLGRVYFSAMMGVTSSGSAAECATLSAQFCRSSSV